MNASDPVNMSPADAHSVLAKVAALLGVEPDHDSVTTALEQLCSVVTGNNPKEQAARRQLTPSQRKIAAEMKLSAVDYLAVRSAQTGAGRL